MSKAVSFGVWKSYYMTYAEVARLGDKPPERVAENLSFDAAQALVGRLGFGYCVKPRLEN